MSASDLCWFCGRGAGLERYALTETPTRHALSAHPECLERRGVGGELVVQEHKEEIE